MAATTQISTTLTSALRRIQPMDSGEPLVQRSEIGSRELYTDGTADGQVDESWDDARSLATGSETLDLQSLTQLDADGGTVRSGISFTKVKVFHLINTTDTSSTGHLLVGGAATNAWEGSGALIEGAGDKIRLAPGEELIVRSTTGKTVSAGSKDLKIESVTADQTYTLLLAGN